MKNLKVLISILPQIKENWFVRIRFLASFILYYTFKKLFHTSYFVKLIPKMRIKLYDYVFEARKGTLDFWVLWKDWEKRITEFLLNQRNVVFIDVGAHIGRYTVLMAKNNTVYSFEPLEQNYRQLIKNLGMNNLKAYVKKIAIADFDGMSYIYYNAHKTGEATLRKKGSEKQKVKVRKLDTIFKRKFKKKVILKIDAEGYTYEVLKGARRFISNNNPIIICEIFRENKDKIEKLLEDYGYFKRKFYWSLKNK